MARVQRISKKLFSLMNLPAKRKNSFIGQFIMICYGVLFSACGNQNDNKFSRDTPTKGTINISVDESFKPVIDSEIKVFESSYPNAHIIPHYKAEAACLRDLAQDSTRMIIVTRGLTPDEEKYYKDSIDFQH